jgi:hypothetical protein
MCFLQLFGKTAEVIAGISGMDFRQMYLTLILLAAQGILRVVNFEGL